MPPLTLALSDMCQFERCITQPGLECQADATLSVVGESHVSLVISQHSQSRGSCPEL